MCGIAGFYDVKANASREELQLMIDALVHRGPDGAGSEIYNERFGRIGLGHRRLSILDLSEHGSQPMREESESYTIVFNGEVYNFQEIKKQLEDEGVNFFSTSDTEVVLKAYIRWGMQAVHKFNGMFAFAIYDKNRTKLILCRDRAGVKPLYYYSKNGLFLFASELKALCANPYFEKRIEKDVVPLFFRYGYVPTPNAIFRNTYKLEPGYFLELDLPTGQIKKTKYWDVNDFYNMPLLGISEEEALEEAESIFTSAFKYRMVSDVPVGIFLSGGYDSTAVTSILQHNMTEKLKTFTIGFEDEQYNEAHDARKISKHLGTDHVEYYCSEKDAMEMMSVWPTVYDEPFIDTSSIATILVSKLARSYVKVALSADGGDEEFVGYDHTIRKVNEYHKIKDIPEIMRYGVAKSSMLFSDLSKLYKGTNRYAIGIINKLWKIYGKYGISEISDLAKRGRCTEYRLYRLFGNRVLNQETLFDTASDLLKDLDPINKLVAIDYKNYMMDDILTKVDRATMFVSLEGREPLLDHRIIEFAARLPVDYKYRLGMRKILLKKIVHKYVPHDIMDRPKKGFAVPLEKWLRGELSSYVHEYLGDANLKKHGFFNTEYVKQIKKTFLANGQEFNLLLTLLIFQMWYTTWAE